MATLAVMAVVDAVIAAHWTHTAVYELNDLATVPADNAAFLAVGYPARTEEPLSIGSSNVTHQEEGAVTVVLFIPIGTGINEVAAPWMTRIEALMAEFRNLLSGGVEFLGFVGPVTNDQSDIGAYYEISFSAPYRYLFVG